MFEQLKKAWSHSKNKVLFDHLESLFKDRDLVDNLTNAKDYVNITAQVKDIQNVECFTVFVDATPLLYIIPVNSSRIEYKIYYRVGFADIYTSSLLSLDLNIQSKWGSIVSFPESMDLNSALGLYYCVYCRSNEFNTKNKILSFLLPVQREVSYKLNLVISRVINAVNNEKALDQEFNLNSYEEYDDDDDGDDEEEEYHI